MKTSKERTFQEEETASPKVLAVAVSLVGKGCYNMGP